MRFSEWDAIAGEVPVEALETADAVVHLAGEPIGQRWKREVKAKIHDTRVLGTRSLVRAIADLRQRPQTMISASAIGYYGDRGDEILTEDSVPGAGFLPDVCVQWEQTAREAGELGLRVVLLRTGLVLGKEGGALKEMLTPFKLGVGGRTGSGQQWMSWIHADDLVSAIALLLTRTDLAGPVNLTTPNPVRNRDFTKELGRALGRPALIPTPTFALRLMLGEAMEILLASQRVRPAVLERAAFEYRYPELKNALRHEV
jgi:uncharacterized protein (TIGR01777 family)